MENKILKTELVNWRELELFQPNDFKKMSEGQMKKIKESFKKNGFKSPFYVWETKTKTYILDGHTRVPILKMLEDEGEVIPEMLPANFIDCKNKKDAKKAVLIYNSHYANIDQDSMFDFVSDLNLDEITSEIDISGIDFDVSIDIDSEEKGSLSERFIVPPFSVLDTRQGYWKERKKVWKDKIGDNAETRESAVVFNQTIKRGGELVKVDGDGVSLLDPVLAELVNLWFGLPGGKTFDCFAGDTVFGFVSASCGNKFTGIELRKEQAKLNQKRVDESGLDAKYICDDGQKVLKHIKEKSQDLMFSCPPYFNLEVYSDLENDASNQGDYEEFLGILEKAFSDSLVCLKDDRFAVITVGDVRDKKTGVYYRLVDDIKDIFKKNGVYLYNELVLVEMIGTARLRVGRYMKNRKVAKTHQNVLVFFKGDPGKIKDIYPELEGEYEG